MTHFYVDPSGAYQGGWDVPDAALPKNTGWVEIPVAPDYACDVWTGNGWDISHRPQEPT